MSVLYVVSFVTIVVALITYNSRQPISRLSLPRDVSTESQSEETEESCRLSEAKGTWFSRFNQPSFK